MRKLEEQTKGTYAPLTLADFDVFTAMKPRPGDPPTWSENEGVISCTGTPHGYLYSKKSYRNFDLYFEYRFEKLKDRSGRATLNTGCLIFIQGEHRRWPVGLEVQGKWLDMGMIKSNARHVKVDADDDPKARTESRTDPDRWHEIRVRALHGELMVQINGTTVAGSRASALTSGLIGFQSEGSKVEFRKIRIQEFPDNLPKDAERSGGGRP